MSALFAVAASSARKTEDLAASEVDRTALKDFLSGQKLTAGSSDDTRFRMEFATAALSWRL